MKLRFGFRLGLVALAITLACDSEAPAPASDAAAEVVAPAPDAPAATADPSVPKIPAPPPPRFPRGLVVREPGVTDGYVLFNPLLSGTTYLVDNQGRIVHTWETPYSPGGGMYLLDDGHLLRPGRDPGMLGFRAGGTGGILQKLAWDGTVVWEWRLSNDAAVQHHDLEPLPNGNVLVLAWEVKTAEEARQAGRRPDLVPEQGLWPDWLMEIEPTGPRGARVVWEWHAWDHLVQDHDPEAANHGRPAEHPEKVDLNAGAHALAISPDELAKLQALGYVPPDATADDLRSDFLHTNSVSYHPRLDQIVMSIPSLGEVWIIDHDTTTETARGPAGDLLYRWGHPANHGQPGGPRLFFQHDARWIPDGWEGAGNLTIFNNGRDRPEGPWSSIDEWTPPVDEDGRYLLGDDGRFGPTDLAWHFTTDPPTDFYAPFISGAHRLANGNTMICAGTGGRLLEVTRGGDIVWEYRNPFSGDVRNEDGSMPQPGLDDSPYAVFRATRIATEHPALAGRTLAPLDPQPEPFAFPERGE